ncbi:MAG TPA: DUF3098 domain-containing protein [Chitinophagaceae bacterium]|jgi:hypothetical protein|nr:DUF3098 domain-containing protein [Chitinophagaceae bacterium]
MSEKKQVTPTSNSSLFDKQNMLLMLLGVAVIAIGMLLMVGGRSNDPNTFNYDEVYSTLRISVAPVLIIIGLGIEIYAIFKKPKV